MSQNKKITQSQNKRYTKEEIEYIKTCNKYDLKKFYMESYVLEEYEKVYLDYVFYALRKYTYKK